MPDTRSDYLDTDALTLTLDGETHQADDLGTLEDAVDDAREEGRLTLDEYEEAVTHLDTARLEALGDAVAEITTHTSLTKSDISRRMGRPDNYIRRKLSGHGPVYMGDIWAVRHFGEQYT